MNIHKRNKTVKKTKIKMLMTLTGIAMLTSTAYASSLPTWTGLYAGPQIGGIFNKADLTSKQLGFVDPSATCNDTARFSSVYPGAQIGYAHEFNSRMVLGIEGDFTYNLHKTGTVTCPCLPDPSIADRFTVKNRLQGSLRGRIGYALNNHLLPFILAGGSLANLGLTYNNEGGDHYSTRTTKSGWLAGLGLEWPIAPAWSIRAEYFYTDYHHFSMKLPTVYGLSDPTGKARVKLYTNNVRLALNYWF